MLRLIPIVNQCRYPNHVKFTELNLNTPILNALEELGFHEATPIQEKAFPVILSGKDMVGIAQTGTGKTMAFLLPILKNLPYSEQKHPRVLIVVPTRELVDQIIARLQELTAYISCRSLGVYGGTNINTQKQVIHDNGIDILVATPGRLTDLALSGVLRLKSIKQLVIDEMDEMLDLGFRPQLLNILDLLPQKRQNLLFSATITSEVEFFVDRFFLTPVKIEAAGAGTPLNLITQKAYEAPNFLSKTSLLKQFLSDESEFSKVLVFVSSRKFADRLMEQLEVEFPDQIGTIHSNKSQNYRINTVEAFSNGTIRVLIATDLISRGIDIKEVSHVVNFHLPEEGEHYTHRIGRTGRAGKTGIALSLVSDKEWDHKKQIEKSLGKEIPIFEPLENISFTDELIDEERIKSKETNYLPKPKKPEIGGAAFHDKKAKNQKTNQGGSYKKKIKEKYKKPKTRGQKKRGKK